MSATVIHAVSNGQQSHSHPNAIAHGTPHHVPTPHEAGHGADHGADKSHHHDGHSHHGEHKGSAGHHHAPPPKTGVRTWTWQWLLVSSAVIGVALLATQIPSRGLPHITGAALSHQIETAAKGVMPEGHLDGIVIRTVSSSGVIVVTAEQVPPKLCVSAGWDLVKDGTLSINGVTPMRVSAARLAELCNTNPPATLTWAPDPAG